LARNTSRAFLATDLMLTVTTLVYLPGMADTFREYPLLFLVPAGAVLAVINTLHLIEKGRYFRAFLSSSLTTALLLLTVAINLYPNMLISTLDPAWTITIYNGAASQKSLGIMLLIAAVGVPLVAVYTIFVFWTFRGKVKLDDSSY
jgi:cytochrome d ubiquinol oxidase subunit II